MSIPAAERVPLIHAGLGHHGIAHVLSCTIPRDEMADADFQAIMSTLPFTTSLHSLNVQSRERDAWEIHFPRSEEQDTWEAINLPWIAYAIFHPRASSSSLRHLRLDNPMLTPYTTHVLTAMSRGNNLLAMLNGTPPDTSAYYSGSLTGGTIVHLHASAESKALCVVPSTGMTVDAVGISFLDRLTWGDWVGVIVSAYGLGWVRSNELDDVQAHAPSTQSITSLELKKAAHKKDSRRTAVFPITDWIHATIS